MSSRSKDDLFKSLTNQPPQSSHVVRVMEDLRAPAKSFASMIIDKVPFSREQSLALTHLEEAVMWAIKGVALNQEHVIDAGYPNWFQEFEAIIQNNLGVRTSDLPDWNFRQMYDDEMTPSEAADEYMTENGLRT